MIFQFEETKLNPIRLYHVRSKCSIVQNTRRWLDSQARLCLTDIKTYMEMLENHHELKMESMLKFFCVIDTPHNLKKMARTSSFPANSENITVYNTLLRTSISCYSLTISV